MKPLFTKQFFIGFSWAAIMAGIVFAATAVGHTDTLTPTNIQQASDNVAEARGKQEIKQELRACAAQARELSAQWTVIYDVTGAPSVPGVDVFHGLARIEAGRALMAAQSQIGARWVIPMKVPVYVYGPNNGARFLYYNPKTFMSTEAQMPVQTDGTITQGPQ